jgi:excisionase family DNA binding protein
MPLGLVKQICTEWQGEPQHGATSMSRPEVTGRRILAAKWDGRTTLTIDEVGEILGLSRPSAYAAANRGDLPVIRVGRRFIVPRHALERMLDEVSRPVTAA